MGGIADHGLVEIANLNGDASVDAGDGAEIAGMTVAADPHRRTLRQRAALLHLKPFIELDGAAAHIGMRRARHLQGLSYLESRSAVGRPQRFLRRHYDPIKAGRSIRKIASRQKSR